MEGGLQRIRKRSQVYQGQPRGSVGSGGARGLGSQRNGGLDTGLWSVGFLGERGLRVWLGEMEQPLSECHTQRIVSSGKAAQVSLKMVEGGSLKRLRKGEMFCASAAGGSEASLERFGLREGGEVRVRAEEAESRRGVSAPRREIKAAGRLPPSCFAGFVLLKRIGPFSFLVDGGLAAWPPRVESGIIPGT